MVNNSHSGILPLWTIIYRKHVCSASNYLPWCLPDYVPWCCPCFIAGSCLLLPIVYLFVRWVACLLAVFGMYSMAYDGSYYGVSWYVW